MDLTSRLDEHLARAAAQVQPGGNMAGGGPFLEAVERVEPEFPIIPVGAEEVPYPVHPAVRHGRRAFQVVVTQEPHHC
jgi:hypothetical protein